MQDSNQVSLPALFNNILKFHTYLHILLTSEFVDFRFPNKGSKFIPSTIVPLLGTMSDAEIQLISGGSFGEVYSARRNEPGKIVAKRWFVKRIIGGCMNCEIHEITTGCCLGGRPIYFLIWKYVCKFVYWICEDTYVPNIFLYTYMDVLEWQGDSVCFAFGKQQQTNGKHDKSI